MAAYLRARDAHVATGDPRLPGCFTLIRFRTFHCLQAPLGSLAPTFHLLSALTNMHLISEKKGTRMVPFEHGHQKYWIMTQVVKEARKKLASRLTADTFTRLRRPLKIDEPDFSLMQQLFDAGIGQCPLSGMPVFDPSTCTPELRDVIWETYCGVAIAVNTKLIGDTSASMDTLKRLIIEHTEAQSPGADEAF